MRKALLLLLLAVLALPVVAETTRFWRQENFDDFLQGTADGVALRSDGEILLAPRLEEFADPNLEFLWAVAADDRGNFFVGGGSPAKVVKISASGETTTVFESKELEVHSLVFDSRSGSLYIATSPDGKIYRLPRQGDAVEFFNPGTKYLWDLVRAADGTFFLATGDKGEIYRITPDGKGEVFFSSEETHVRALALDPSGMLYAGTEPNGLVLRISPQGEGFVVYETDRTEVTTLTRDPQGNLFVAAIGQKMQAPAYPVTPPVQTLPQQQTGGGQGNVTVSTVVTAQAISTPGLPFPAGGGSDVYRIHSDGYPEILWSSNDDLVYSLAVNPNGRLLVGTGNEGRLLGIDSSILYSNLVKTASQQVTALLPAADGGVYVGTANPGKLYKVGPGHEAEGSFESQVFDAEIFSRWGRIRWQSRNPAGDGSVSLYTRSGNTSDPQKNWSPWSEAYTNADGVTITSPAARFIQWKAVLRATDSRTPGLSGVGVAYLRRNIAPVVEKIVIQEPGVAVRGYPQPPQQSQPVQLNLPPPSNRQARTNPLAAYQQQQIQQAGQQRIETPPQGVTEAGTRSVIWSADDDNDDDLVYTVYYRGENETRWKTLAEDVTDKFYSWEAATLPDGAYYIRVAASDQPSNPIEIALTGENISDRFEVDNTPPLIEGLAATAARGGFEVSFTARDSFSALLQTEYSVDAGEWETIFPDSGTTDSREHRYHFQLKDLEPGEHTVVVRVFDRSENPALDKVTFTAR